MNTKILMVATSLYFGIVGIGLTFLPQEIGGFLNTETNSIFTLALQIIGALYLGFGMLNWMSKDSLIGGIYGRPIVIANYMHFLVSAFALINMIGAFSDIQFSVMIVVLVLHAIFAISFGVVLRTVPKIK